GVAGVDAATDAVLREHRVEPGQQLVAGHLRAVQRHGLALDEAQRRAQRFDRPRLARRAPAARAFARRVPAVDLAAGHGQAEQVLVDRVGLLLRAHAEAAFLQILLLVGAGPGVLLLDFPDRRDDAVIAGS